jgi:hypothetical protein
MALLPPTITIRSRAHDLVCAHIQTPFAGQLYLVPLSDTSVRLVPLIQPTHRLSQLPLIRCPDEVWLGADVQNAVAVPMVSAASDQHLVRPIPRASIVAMIAEVSPHITAAVNQG